MVSALLMWRRFAAARRVALHDQDFARILGRRSC
jgi:hypothetical protein